AATSASPIDSKRSSAKSVRKAATIFSRSVVGVAGAAVAPAEAGRGDLPAGGFTGHGQTPARIARRLIDDLRVTQIGMYAAHGAVPRRRVLNPQACAS